MSFSLNSLQGELRICVLPSHLSYDAPWPVRKVPTKATPHFVAFHLESKTHPVVLSEQAPLKEVPVGEDSTQHEPVEKGTAMLGLGRLVDADTYTMYCILSLLSLFLDR